MTEIDSGRECELKTDRTQNSEAGIIKLDGEIGIFKMWGKGIFYKNNDEIDTHTIAIVELKKTGEVLELKPHEIKFKQIS